MYSFFCFGAFFLSSLTTPLLRNSHRLMSVAGVVRRSSEENKSEISHETLVNTGFWVHTSAVSRGSRSPTLKSLKKTRCRVCGLPGFF